MKTEPSWLQPMLEKRNATAICILSELLKAGLRRGECSANDITVKLLPEEHNVVGGVFRRLNSCGFKQSDRRVDPRKKASHGRKVYVWELQNHARAKSVLSAMSGVLLELREPEQLELL